MQKQICIFLEAIKSFLVKMFNPTILVPVCDALDTMHVFFPFLLIDQKQWQYFSLTKLIT